MAKYGIGGIEFGVQLEPPPQFQLGKIKVPIGHEWMVYLADQLYRYFGRNRETADMVLSGMLAAVAVESRSDVRQVLNELKMSPMGRDVREAVSQIYPVQD